MGCCTSSPHSRRQCRNPADFDEETVPLRYFGKFRNGSVAVPDEIPGLPSTHQHAHLASDPNVLLYEGEIDQGYACRCLRYLSALPYCPYCLTVSIPVAISAIQKFFLGSGFPCDQLCCWVRKEYSTRTYFRVYSNRIEINIPTARFPWGCLGCGSWNADHIVTHPFDRGAFGFRKVHCCVEGYCCCIWPCFGGIVARQRCPCNGPLWNRMFTDCNGWWCDEWPCDIMCCSYHYKGLADPDEAAFAASICLQSYFEGRALTRDDVDKCILFWSNNISEAMAGTTRDVCCEPHFKLPFFSGFLCYKWCCHPRRNVPYRKDNITDKLQQAYDDYNKKCEEQIELFAAYQGPVRSSTLCRKCGCRRFFGRKGFIFCTEGCNNFSRKASEPAPAFDHRDIDDENDASVVLRKVLGPPPRNVVYKRWEFDEESGETVLVTVSDQSVATVIESNGLENSENQENEIIADNRVTNLLVAKKLVDGTF